MRKERFKEIFEKLFLLCSVQLLEEIENSGYEMDRSETYRDYEKEVMQETAKESADVFALDVFQD